MGHGESSMSNIKPNPLTQIAAITAVGDLVHFIGDADGQQFGYGVVVKAYRHNSVIRWANSGDYNAYANCSLVVVAKGRAKCN